MVSLSATRADFLASRMRMDSKVEALAVTPEMYDFGFVQTTSKSWRSLRPVILMRADSVSMDPGRLKISTLFWPSYK